MNTRLFKAPSLLWAALVGLTFAVGPSSSFAQSSYIPRPPQPDTLLYQEDRKDPRIAPRGAAHPPSTDPHVPNKGPAIWGNRDYFGIPVDPESYRLIPVVENGHLGPKTNPRGFWPRFTKGQYDYAVSELKYVLGVFPNHPRALHLLGIVAKAMKTKTIPIAYYENAIRLYPDHAFTHAQYGAYLVDTGETAQGMRELERALVLDPNLLVARAWLDKAKRELGLAQGADPDQPSTSPKDLQPDLMYVPRR